MEKPKVTGERGGLKEQISVFKKIDNFAIFLFFLRYLKKKKTPMIWEFSLWKNTNSVYCAGSAYKMLIIQPLKGTLKFTPLRVLIFTNYR